MAESDETPVPVDAGDLTDSSTTADPEFMTPAAPGVPVGVRLAADWAWRLLVLGLLVYALFWLVTYFSAVTLPVVLAIMLTALLNPGIAWLRRRGWNPYLASGAILLGTFIVVGAIFFGVGAQVANEAPGLVERTMDGIAEMLNWLATGPLHIQATAIDDGWLVVKKWVSTSQMQIARYVATVGSSVGSFFAGMAVTLMSAFFFGANGREIFTGVENTLIPSDSRQKVSAAAGRGWISLVAYMRAQVIVAAVDAVGIAVSAFFLGLPLVSALFALTFFTSFIPVVGAVLAGTVAVALALVTKGWVAALIMLAATIVVMQAEGNLLAPLLLGKAVNLHPLAVLLGLIVGATLGGIVGALLAIPALAFLVAFTKALRSDTEILPPELLKYLPDSGGSPPEPAVESA